MKINNTNFNSTSLQKSLQQNAPKGEDIESLLGGYDKKSIEKYFKENSDITDFNPSAGTEPCYLFKGLWIKIFGKKWGNIINDVINGGINLFGGWFAGVIAGATDLIWSGNKD